jgi:ParB-like chromosome segregation protein Spo0J
MTIDNIVPAKKTDGQIYDNNPTTDVHIKEANQHLIPALSIKEYELLKESIRENGLLVPIVVNQEGVISDGAHRYRACKELGIPIDSIMKQFNDSFEENLFQIEINLQRRQMNAYQRIEVGYSLEGILRENAKKRMSLGGTIVGLGNGNRKESNSNQNERVASAEATLQSIKEKGKVSKIIARKIGVSTSMYERGKKIIKEANESQKNSLRDGSATLNKVYNQIRKKQIAHAIAKKQVERELNAKLIRTDKQQRVEFINGEFLDKQHFISDSSVDLIFTNPTNYTKDLQIYRTLAHFASRVLKPGGSLLTYVPNHLLPQVFKNMDMDMNMSTHNLEFWWQLAIREDEITNSLEYQVYSAWSPLLWYVKAERPKSLNSISDLIEPSLASEIIDGKQKPLAQLEYIISRLSIKNDVVVDPFMGAGIIGRAALNLDRHFIGIERDSQTFLSAQAELSNEYVVQKVEQVS